MTKEKILADDMTQALRKVKEQFGSEAFILGTRSIHERIPGSLNSRSQVELTVSLEAPKNIDREDLRPLQLDSSGRFIDDTPSLESELERLDSLLAEMEEEESRLEDLQQPGYPLMTALREWGIFEPTLRRLIRDFEQEIPRVDRHSSELALERIRGGLHLVDRMKVEELRGIHALTGLPGSGKTSLAIKLAERVSGTGATVAILCYDPRHAGEVARLEEASSRYGFEVALAEDQLTLLGAMRHLSSRDFILLDMPPIEEAHWDILEKLEKSLHREPVFRHLVVAADGGWRALEPAAGAADFLAVTRADRDSALRPVLDLQAHGDFNIGFISSGPEPGSSLVLAEAETLMKPLVRRVLKRSAAKSRGNS